MKEMYNMFLRDVKLNGKILDAGCGSGRDSKYFISKGYHVTSFDGSEEMVKLSSKLLNKKALLMDFNNLKLEEKYDGIWACASLLHINKENLPKIIKDISEYLNKNAVFYMSFKYGNKEYTKDNRYFNCYDEENFKDLINNINSLEIKLMKITSDVRKDRENEKWLNVICKKV